MKRVQYYTPEGEKLPVAVKRNNVFYFSKHHLGYYIVFQSMVDNFVTVDVLKNVDWITGESHDLCYATDFTEEELKELKDEKDI